MKDDKKLELDFEKSIPRKEPKKPYQKPGNLDSIITVYKNESETKKRIKSKNKNFSEESLLFRIILSSVLILGYYYFIAKYIAPSYGSKVSLFASAGFFIYLLTAYIFRPKPDMNNLGYLGGFINKPFDYSDDINRFLLFLKIILYPGVLISETIKDIYFYIKK